jgi:hypothetical protein
MRQAARGGPVTVEWNGKDTTMSNLPEYMMLRGALSIGKNRHFFGGVRGPVQLLLRLGQMFFSAAMIFLPILYFLLWKDTVLLWLAGGAFLVCVLLVRWEQKWIQMPHMRDKDAKAGIQ